jgi:hypothetical protein
METNFYTPNTPLVGNKINHATTQGQNFILGSSRSIFTNNLFQNTSQGPTSQGPTPLFQSTSQGPTPFIKKTIQGPTTP